MSRAENLALAQLARTQRGVVSARDLKVLTGRPDELRRRVRSGLWSEIVPGVLAPAAVPADSNLRAAALMVGIPRAVLSHYAAARRSGIWVPEADQTWVTVPFSSPLREIAGIRIVRSRRSPEIYVTDGFLRWTTPARTVCDLGMCLTPKQLEGVLLSAVRQKITTASEVDDEAAQLPGRRGLMKVRAVTLLWRPERESMLEDRLHEDVCSVVGGGVVRQLRVPDGHGRIAARLDVAAPELRLAFEADGLHFHSTDEQIAADQRRDRTLMALGWLIVRFREGALDDRSAVRREIAAVVDRRRRDLRLF